MAIKGKARSRGGKPAPRIRKPTYVPVSRPLVRRRGFWIAVAAVLVAGSAVGITIGSLVERSNRRETEAAARLASTMRTLQSQIDPVLAEVGQPKPPAGFAVFSTLGGTLDGLRSGSTSAKEAGAAAKTVAQQAETVASAIDKIDVTGIVADKGFDQTFVNYALNAQRRFVSAFRLYRDAAAMIEAAATLDDAGRTKVLDTAKSVLATATQLFDQGYSDYVEAQANAGTFAPNFGASGPGGLGGLGGFGGSGAATGAGG